MNAIVGNWTLSDTHQYRSGALIALTCANTLGNGVLFTDARMCNENGGPVLTGQSRTSLNPNNPASLYFNAAAFSVPGQFSFGTSSQYNSKFRQPPVLVDNIALLKQLAVWPKGDGTRVRLQFQANAFQRLQPDQFRCQRHGRQRQLRTRYRPAVRSSHHHHAVAAELLIGVHAERDSRGRAAHLAPATAPLPDRSGGTRLLSLRHRLG